MVRRRRSARSVQHIPRYRQEQFGDLNALVVGPWVHGGWARYDGEHLGRVEFSFNTGEYYRKNILFPFFEQYLKGNGDAKLPKPYFFETATKVGARHTRRTARQER